MRNRILEGQDPSLAFVQPDTGDMDAPQGEVQEPGLWDRFKSSRQEKMRERIMGEKSLGPAYVSGPVVLDETPEPAPEPEWNPARIKEAWDNGEIDFEQVKDLSVAYGMQTDYWGMSVNQLKHAHATDRLSTEQVISIMDRQDHPYWWFGKDTLRGVATGTFNFMENMSKTAGDISNWAFDREDDWSFREAPEKPESLPGQITAIASEWGLAFASAGKVLQGAGALQAFRQSPKMLELARTHPKVATFLDGAVIGGTKGAAADYVSFDPYDGRIADFMHENEMLPEYMGFMLTNEENPEWLERLKHVAEGVFLGTALEGVLLGARALKARNLSKFDGDLDSMSRAALEHPDPKVRQATIDAQQAAKTRSIEEAKRQRNVLFRKFATPVEDQAAKQHEIKFRKFEDPAKAVESPAPKLKEDPTTTDPTTTDPTAMDPEAIIRERLKNIDQAEANKTKSLNVLRGVLQGHDAPPGNINILKKVESLNGEIHLLMDLAYKEDFDIITAARGLGTTHAMKDADAVKMFADMTGGTPDSIMNTARALYGDIKDVSTKAHLLYRMFDAYGHDLIDACRKYDGGYRELMRLTEHFGRYREFMKMVNGASSESGKFLEAQKIKLGKQRFDFSDIVMDTVPDNMKSAKNAWDKVIRRFGEMPDTMSAAKTARGFGHTWPYWLLRYAQSNILWGPVTHVGNITSQVAAALWRATAQGLVDAATSAVTMDSRHLGKWWQSQVAVGHALKVAFEGSTNPAKHFKRARQAGADQNITFRAALQQDPELGTFYKALFGAKGIIDPSTKVDDHIRISNALKTSKLARLGSMFDTTMTLPFHALAGVDEVFKGIGTLSHYYRSVYQKGMKQGLNGKALDDYFNKELFRGDFKSLREAMDQTEQFTRQQRMELMRMAQPKTWDEGVGIGQQMTYQDHLGGGFFGEMQKPLGTPVGAILRALGAPFYKTLVNLLKFSHKNSPIGWTSSEVRKQLGKGGPDMWEALTRMAMGGAVVWYGLHKYRSGELIGTLPYDQRSLLRQARFPEMSMKIGEYRVDLRRGYPFTTLMVVAADLYKAGERYMLYENTEELDGAFEELILGIMSAFVEPMFNATFAKGMKDLSEIAMEPASPGGAGRMKRFGLDLVGRAIPAGTAIKWFKSEFTSDDYFREINTMMDQVWALLDSDRLIIRRDPIFGEQEKRTPRRWYALHQAKETHDPILLEMVKVGATVQRVREHLTLDGQKIKITPKEREKFYEIYESFNPREGLTFMIESPEYKELTDKELRKQLIQGTLSDYRGMATAKFLKGDQAQLDKFKRSIKLRAQRLEGLRPSVHPSTSSYKFIDADN